MALCMITSVLLLSFGSVGGTTPFFAADMDVFLHPASRASVDANVKSFLGDGTSASRQAIEGHLADKMEHLRTIFQTLPHNRLGNLDTSGVRYLLYRHFLQHRAWLMRGLAPDGETWNASFPIDILRAPAEVEDLVEGRLKGRGLSLQESAVLAMILEKQVHLDAMDRLEVIWQAHGLEPGDVASRSTMESIMDTHVLGYIQPDVWNDMTERSIGMSDVKQLQEDIRETYPNWPRTQRFLRDALDGVTRAAGEGWDLEEAKHTTQQIVDHFGRWQDVECRQLKHKLLSMEMNKPGRVDLASFYGTALSDEKWFFNEPVPYLRLLGTLDETDPMNPSVMVPNYVSSATNHLGASQDFYLACMDECQELLGHIEHLVGSPSGTPERIAAIVRSLPTPSEPSRPDVPEALFRKLEELAVAGGGRVQLHGRLFALWLHNAYPRDCPYPHLAGRTKQLSAEEYQLSTGAEAAETPEGMRAAIRTVTEAAKTSTPLPWDLEEELYTRPDNRYLTGWLCGAAFGMVTAGLIMVMGLACRRRSRIVRSMANGPLLDIGDANNLASASGAAAVAHQASACS